MLERVVVLRPLPGLDLADFFADGDHGDNETVKL